MRHITVEGTSFNPTLGGVVGVKSLDRSLEVGALVHGVPSMLYGPLLYSIFAKALHE